MTVKEIAEKLNGNEYGLGNIEISQIKEAGIIFAYGESDDLLEFRGAIYDEFDCYDGGECKITKELKVFNEDENRDTLEYNQKEIDAMKTIQAIWAPKDEKGEVYASWLITTDIPHETFDMMEDGELFCRGIVFDKKYILKDIK